jgi:hypothetical protein
MQDGSFRTVATAIHRRLGLHIGRAERKTSIERLLRSGFSSFRLRPNNHLPDVARQVDGASRRDPAFRPSGME